MDRYNLVRTIWPVVFALAVSGCKLENPPEFGERCPPGTPMLKGEQPYVALNTLNCFSGSVEISGAKPTRSGQSLACDEKCPCIQKASAVDGSQVWSCDISTCQKECLRQIFRDDFTHCSRYQTASFFDANPAPMPFAYRCDFLDRCESQDAENPQYFCPSDASQCGYDADKGGYGCTQLCTQPLIYCNDERTGSETSKTCVNPQTDLQHCGASGDCTNTEGNSPGEACSDGEYCQEGVCICDENKGFRKCDGACVDQWYDPENCGGCGKVCGDGELCVHGTCAKDICGENKGKDNTCFDSADESCKNETEHCGKHCINCKLKPHVNDAECDDGICRVLSCETGYHLSQYADDCIPNSAFACAPQDSSDETDCYRFDPHADEAYCNADGKCMIKHCQKNFTLDNGECQSACILCDAITETCVENVCRCQIGYTFCDGKCVDILNDPDFCGSCSNSCSAEYGTPACEHAVCTISCDSGAHAYQNACEPDSDDHCGSHDHACVNTENEVLSCVSGKCTITACLNDYQLVDGACVQAAPPDPAPDA